MKFLFALVLTLPLTALEPIRVSDDGTHFVLAESKTRFVVWGVNYDHDADGRLLDEYWQDEWATVVEDFGEIKALGANCVRIHLQLGLFMEAPDRPNAAALEQLAKLLKLAESKELYLDITGLACYHKANIPVWYDDLSEVDRWAVQAGFWRAVAKACKDSPAVFCYDLMNEPILAGKKTESDWLGGELGGKFFVQRITRDLKGRTRHDVAAAWVDTLVDAIRAEDSQHMITVGVIPWVFAFGGRGKPLFYAPEVGKRLDFVSVHFYPKTGEVAAALSALKAYEIGKPLVIEEMFPLKCGLDDMGAFIKGSASHVDGWVSFYWGKTAVELEAKPQPTMADAITAKWLRTFAEFARTPGAW